MQYFIEEGITPESSKEQIRGVYRILSRKHHPDRGGETPIFQSIQDAYETLLASDDEESKDQEEDPLFDSFFNFFIGKGVSAVKQFFNKKSPNKHIEVHIPLSDFYSGRTLIIQVNREIICRECLQHLKECEICNERGVITNLFSSVCKLCNNTGVILPAKCEVCGGTHLISDTKQLKIDVKAGDPEASQFIFPEHCSESLTFETPGDILVSVCCEDTNGFVRKGVDLHYTIHLSLVESLLGWEAVLKGHPSRQDIIVSVKDKITLNETNVFVADGGMPNPDKKGFGSLIVRCCVAVPVLDPSTLTTDERALVASLFS